MNWKALAGWDVPGLTIRCTDEGLIKVATEYTCHFADCKSTTGEHHRAAAMLVVDALEAAESVWFDRSGAVWGTVWTAKYPGGRTEFGRARDHDNNEGKTLVALLVKVREAMND